MGIFSLIMLNINRDEGRNSFLSICSPTFTLPTLPAQLSTLFAKLSKIICEILLGHKSWQPIVAATTCPYCYYLIILPEEPFHGCNIQR